ncbi:MAG TPA: ice-binding family protein [Candidatus Acidoferrales bacterium]|nr:ice-binding family protein [Candidatus Acidoferrales bacterium]
MSACGTNAVPAMPGQSASSPQVQTAALAPHALAPINLRSAALFAILAGSTVTSTGQTRIGGNIGIFPGTARTGFPPALITQGAFHSADGMAKQAEADLTTAYNAAMGLVNNPILVAGNLGGRTLKPGLYKSTSGLAVSSGDLTLDGGGNPNAVWVFQMASTFNMTPGRKIILTNGAKPRNIFWAVGTSATLGTTCSFYGTLMAHQSISMATGTVMTGRALARVGAVTMQDNTIVKSS